MLFQNNKVVVIAACTGVGKSKFLKNILQYYYDNLDYNLTIVDEFNELKINSNTRPNLEISRYNRYIHPELSGRDGILFVDETHISQNFITRIRDGKYDNFKQIIFTLQLRSENRVPDYIEAYIEFELKDKIEYYIIKINRGGSKIIVDFNGDTTIEWDMQPETVFNFLNIMNRKNKIKKALE